MTLRLCVIGNSHVASLANGWKIIGVRHPDVSVTFFAATGARLEDLQPRNGALVPQSAAIRRKLRWVSGGHGSIVAADYDAFWLVGLRLGVETIMPAYADFWSEEHRADPTRAPVSASAFAAASAGLLRAAPAVTVHDRLRSLTDAPIVLVPQPNPSLDALDGIDTRTEPFRLAARNGDEAALWTGYHAALDTLARERSFAVAHQPDSTRCRAIFTEAAHAHGSIKLARGLESEHKERDVIHMNADFGALMIDHHLPHTRASA